MIGVILAGGKSLRMGHDKSTLVMSSSGDSQRLVLYKLLSSLLPHVIFSLNKEQAKDSFYQDKLFVVDDYSEIGPVGGILTVLNAYPNQSCLVLACDLVHCSANFIKTLLEEHDPTQDGTFCQINEKNIEPLIGIYESSLKTIIEEKVARQQFSLQKILSSASIKKIVTQENILNINTKQELNLL